MKRKMHDTLRAPKLIGAYEKHQEIGRGTYGTVYAGVRHSSSSSTDSDAPAQRVAIKKVLGRVDAGKRESAFLERCRGAKHVVQLLDVVERNDKLYLVLEYMASDLEAMITDTAAVPELPIAHVKTYLHMLLTGVQELHCRNILHRDLKPNNLLLSALRPTVKITDFGMATTLTIDAKTIRPTDPTIKRSLQVVTRAYRSPELFFGAATYGAEVDVWSVGCIFGELLLRKPLFDGASDLDQLSRIFALLGSPAENQWHDAAALPFFLQFKDTDPQPLRTQLALRTECSDTGIELLSQLLTLDPAKRISVDAALAHPFFFEAPLPVDASALVVPEDPQRAVRKAPVAGLTAAAEVVAVDSDSERAFMIKGRRLL